MKILIVEDDPSSLKLTTDVVQSGGHVVMLTTSADQAMKAGCDAYIVKPIYTRTLSKQIEDVVAAKAQVS